MNKKETYFYSGGKQKEKIRLSKSTRVHVRHLRQEEKFDKALEFKEKALESKKKQQRGGLENLEGRLKKELDPYKIAEMKFTIPWLKEKLGDITLNERKKNLKEIIMKFDQDTFKKFMVEKNGKGRTKVREIIDKKIMPSAKEPLRECTELEIKQMAKERFNPEENIKTEFALPWLKEKLGDITEYERKKDIKKIITGLEPDIFKKFVMEENGNGKTKVREIIDKIFPREESLNELEELEIKQMGEKYLSSEEALKIKFTHIWVEVKLDKIVKDEERFKKITNLYKSYPDIAEAFKRDKAKEIINNLFPRENSKNRGIGHFAGANKKD